MSVLTIDNAVASQLARCCVHFTGVQNKVCKLGVVYQDVRAAGGAFGFPCTGDQGHCEKKKLPTAEAVAAEVAEIDAARARWDAAVAAGRCPECGEPVEPTRRDGRCVYAACGHRLGQGG